MKILMLGWELPPYNSGGLGVACYQLCKALASAGAEIEFIVPFRADFDDINFMRVHGILRQDGFEVMKNSSVYGSRQFPRPAFSNIESAYRNTINHLVRESEFDIIHAHDWLTCRAALQAKLISGKPLLVHFHSVESDRSGQDGGGNPMVREIEDEALHLADGIVAVSDRTRRTIAREYDIPTDKISVVHNHFDPSHLQTPGGANAYMYLRQMKRHGYKVVVNVGRLTIQKGLTHLLEAFKIVVEHEPKTLLLIVGSGEQYHELIQLSADLGIGDKVLFADFQRGKRYRDAYTIGDIFVMPSVSEPFGLTALESVGYGTPVLLTKQSGVGEILQNALKVDYWDTHEMANKIVAVLRSRPLRQTLVASAKNEYRSHGWAESADRLMELYNRHLSGEMS